MRSNNWGIMLLRLKRLFVGNAWGISLTYAFSLLENLFNLFYPFATGLAINGLLKNEYGGLMLFSAIWIAHAVVGVYRQRYDTYVFTRIYAKLATEMALAQHKQGVLHSQIVARSGLAREIVDFFEHDIPTIITSVFGFLGSLIMLMSYDWQIGVACLAFLVPIVFFNRRYSRISLQLNRQLNDQLEREVEVLKHQDRGEIEKHYALLSRYRIGLSNAEATTWGLLEGVLIAVNAFVIIRAASLATVEAGTIYAVLAYLWNYASSLASAPLLVQKASRLQDINGRIVSELDGLG